MRTDYASVCVPCRVRFETSRVRCPLCDGREICAASDRARWSKREAPARGLLSSLFVSAAFGLPRFGSRHSGGLQLFVEEIAVRGRGIEGIVVVADRPLASPFSGEPCVAYRVVGEVGKHEVDDAEATRFTLVLDGGERVLVEPDPAAVAIPVGETIEPDAAAMARLAPLLAVRGIEGSPAYLAEASVRPGDRIVVHGRFEDPPPESDGYRSNVRPRRLRPGLAMPLVMTRRDV